MGKSAFIMYAWKPLWYLNCNQFGATWWYSFACSAGKSKHGVVGANYTGIYVEAMHLWHTTFVSTNWVSEIEASNWAGKF